jgi:hypothetical protein
MRKRSNQAHTYDYLSMTKVYASLQMSWMVGISPNLFTAMKI